MDSAYSSWSDTLFIFILEIVDFPLLFLKVKDGLKILHLKLAKRELEERHIKNKSFVGVDLAGLDLVERNK